MATDTANLAGLLHDARSFDNESKTDLEKIKLALLRSILLALDPMADVSNNGLIEQINCLQCLRPYQIPLIQIALLQQIIEAITGTDSGTGVVVCGSGPPVVAPPTGCGLYIDILTGILWQYYSGSWR